MICLFALIITITIFHKHHCSYLCLCCSFPSSKIGPCSVSYVLYTIKGRDSIKQFTHILIYSYQLVIQMFVKISSRRGPVLQAFQNRVFCDKCLSISRFLFNQISHRLWYKLYSRSEILMVLFCGTICSQRRSSIKAHIMRLVHKMNRLQIALGTLYVLRCFSSMSLLCHKRTLSIEQIYLIFLVQLLVQRLLTHMRARPCKTDLSQREPPKTGPRQQLVVRVYVHTMEF